MSDANNDAWQGADIAKVLSSQGPIVKCVILRTGTDSSNLEDQKPKAKSDDDSNSDDRPILTSLIDEIEIDTTPAKSMVAKTLGGPFTFLGQYEEEGIVLMVRDVPKDGPEITKEELN